MRCDFRPTPPPFAPNPGAFTPNRAAGVAAALCLTLTGSAAIAGDEGVGNHRVGIFNYGNLPGLTVQSGSGFVRGLANWEEMEPTPGEYSFEFLDNKAAMVGDEGLDQVFTFRANAEKYVRIELDNPDRNPTKYSAYPSDMDQWLNYVRAVVERYDGDGIDDMPGLSTPIHAWQIENEWLNQWADTTGSFDELFTATARCIREADDLAIIVGPALGHEAVKVYAHADGFDPRETIRVGPNYAPEFQTRAQSYNKTRRGDSRYRRMMHFFDKCADQFDVLDIHVYASDLVDVESWVSWAKKTMDAYGGKEVWAMEFAAPFYHYSELEHNRMMAPSMAVAFAHGLDRLAVSSLIELDNPQFQQFKLINSALDVRAVYCNMSQATWATRGFEAAGYDVYSPDMCAIRFRIDDGSESVIAWARKPVRQSLDLSVRGAVEVYDMIQPGSEMTDSGRVVLPTGGVVSVTVSQDPVIVLIPASSLSGGLGGGNQAEDSDDGTNDVRVRARRHQRDLGKRKRGVKGSKRNK